MAAELDRIRSGWRQHRDPRALRAALHALLKLLLVALLVAVGGCSDPPSDQTLPLVGPPPNCHQVAVAWCDMQAACGPVGDECHSDWHDLCPGLQDAGAPEVSAACLAALEEHCLTEGLSKACAAR